MNDSFDSLTQGTLVLVAFAYILGMPGNDAYAREKSRR